MKTIPITEYVVYDWYERGASFICPFCKNGKVVCIDEPETCDVCGRRFFLTSKLVEVVEEE